VSQRGPFLTKEKKMNLNVPRFIPMTISARRREDGLSMGLQVGKAGEHLACAALLLQGFNTFFADPGLPYDLLIDRGMGKFLRVQVKSTCDISNARPGRTPNSVRAPVYCFAMRRSNRGERRFTLDACDYLAFVALDIRCVAFLHVSQCTAKTGFAKQLIEFKSRKVTYTKNRTGPDPNNYGRFIEDHAALIEL
jgi:hypothetical protein